VSEGAAIETGETEATCARCGCTQERSCVPRCGWVEPDLCSGCVPSVKVLLEAADAADAAARAFRGGVAAVSSQQPGELLAEQAALRAVVLRGAAAICARLGSAAPASIFTPEDELLVRLWAER